MHTNKQPEVLQSLPSSVATTLGVTRPSPPATVVIDVERLAPEIPRTGVVVANKLPAFSHVPYMTIAVPVHKRGS